MILPSWSQGISFYVPTQHRCSQLLYLRLHSIAKMVEQTSFSVVFKKAEGTLTLSDEGLAFQPNENSNANNSGSGAVTMPWSKISKHQVSPANHAKSLLKIVPSEGAGKSLIFQFAQRSDMERARQDTSKRLQHFRAQQQRSSLSSPSSSLSGSKRRQSDITVAPAAAAAAATVGKTTSTSFGELDPTSLAVTRSSLLAANPTLRAQHQYLVLDSKTVDEDDFWTTHKDLLEEEYARIAGITRAGTSSLLQSHLSTLTGRITLGVEEMRQIFIMYPAVHKAYEEKVPLELSDEQFWRKYLESEYFHRDRGKIGAASRKKGDASGKNGSGNKRVEEARAAAVGTDDIFSRYDQKLRESGQLEDGVFGTGAGAAGDVSGSERARHKKWGTHLAVGQFDLASTFETERGKLLEGPRDNHPVDPEDDGKGAKVIQKYNRHWAMVLNPEDAVAGSNLMEVARKSVDDTIPDDDDAKAGGGLDDEMQRLVGFANAEDGEANHALGMGETDEYEKLTLKNVEVYHAGKPSQEAAASTDEEAKTRKSNIAFANKTVKKMKDLLASKQQSAASLPDDAFPKPDLGKLMMQAMTKKFVVESKTDADMLKVVNSLPEDFKKQLHSYFRRASELLRHFFGLNRLVEEHPENNTYRQKLSRINDGIKSFYEEVKTFRDKIDNSDKDMGVLMRKMVLQILLQMDHAFSSAEQQSGGFTVVETF